MELSKIILILLVVIVVIHLLKNTDLVDLSTKDMKKVKKAAETRVLKPSDKLGNFPIPRSSSVSKPLNESTNNDTTLINNSLMANPSIVNVIRSGINNKESHYPKYYRKDIMSGNTVGSSEYTFAETDNDKSSLAWADQNVSDYPKFYKSDFEGGLTDVGSFFDQSNKYVDITGPRTDANVGDACYTNSKGDKICLENDKLMNVAPQVVDNKGNCGPLNSYNILQYTNYLKYGGGNNKVINGSPFYDGVTGNNRFSLKYDEPLKEQVLSCSL
jgi:hypothetical protein